MSNPQSPSLFSRKTWMDLSHFHPLSDNEVLSLVAERVARFTGTKRPLVLLDLDSTLYEVAPRSLTILKEWVSSQNGLPLELKLSLENLKTHQMGYSVKDTLGNIGFPVVTPELEKVAADLKNFWWDRFFTSDYLPHDCPYPGAVEYANYLYDLGAELCYLTGREETRMRKGTEANLVRDGFPFFTQGTRLIMRTQADWSDALHKTHHAIELSKSSHLVASFENEPINLVQMAKQVPEALHVFVDTVCSDSPVELGKNLYCIRGFSSFEVPIPEKSNS